MFRWFWQSALVDRITPEAIDVPNINRVQVETCSLENHLKFFADRAYVAPVSI